jgi:hypothetical protein
MVLVRARDGVDIDVGDEDFAREAGAAPIRAAFFLVSGEQDPGRHLRILAHLAGRVEEESFMSEWLMSPHEHELKETLLRDDRFLSLRLQSGTKTEPLIGESLRELHMPEGALVALIRRRGQSIVPRDAFIAAVSPLLTRPDEPDLVVLRVEVTGQKNGGQVTHTWDLLDKEDEEAGITAMERTTGFTLAVVGLMMGRDVIDATGVMPPDAGIPVEPYLTEMAKRGVVARYRQETG